MGSVVFKTSVVDKWSIAVEHLWNCTYSYIVRIRPTYSSRNQYHCHLFYNKSHVYWPGVETSSLNKYLMWLTWAVSQMLMQVAECINNSGLKGTKVQYFLQPIGVNNTVNIIYDYAKYSAVVRAMRHLFCSAKHQTAVQIYRNIDDNFQVWNDSTYRK